MPSESGSGIVSRYDFLDNPKASRVGYMTVTCCTVRENGPGTNSLKWHIIKSFVRACYGIVSIEQSCRIVEDCLVWKTLATRSYNATTWGWSGRRTSLHRPRITVSTLTAINC